MTCITDYDSQNPGQMLLVPQEYILKAGAKVKMIRRLRSPHAITTGITGMRPWRCCLQPTGRPYSGRKRFRLWRKDITPVGVKNRTIRSEVPEDGLTVSA